VLHIVAVLVKRIEASSGRLGGNPGPAAVVVDGWVYVSSGDYRSNFGNVLLAFSVDR